MANRPFASPESRLWRWAEADRRSAAELYEAAVHLRGSSLKRGQFASARPDLLPVPHVEQLSKLQDRVPPAPASVVRRTIERDVGPVDELFASFAEDSASAASLAQVHRAVRLDGRPVAVKVLQTGMISRVRPTWRMAEMIMGRLAESEPHAV